MTGPCRWAGGVYAGETRAGGRHSDGSRSGLAEGQMAAHVLDGCVSSAPFVILPRDGSQPLWVSLPPLPEGNAAARRSIPALGVPSARGGRPTQ